MLTTLAPPPTTALQALARAPRLLVAADFDGTLAPLTERPGETVPLSASVAALERLARTPDTDVALLSGRSRTDLQRICGLEAGVWLVGCHGAEGISDGPLALDEHQSEARDAIRSSAGATALAYPGVRVEHKPTGAAVHVRGLPVDAAAAARDDYRRRLARLREVEVLESWEVTEGSAVLGRDKGAALDALRGILGTTHTLWIGDDEHDEGVLDHLSPADVGVRVGRGDTRAPYRVAGPRDVAELLTELARLRRLADEGVPVGAARL